MSGAPVETRRQWRLIAIVLAVVAAVLFAGYYAFFRTPMAPAFQNIREADASAVAAQLGKASIPYRLANDGHDVMVPRDRTSDARVAVAGANIALGGTTGFELFDDSDMGLTEFAQKINFQRAMQGELARTIMAMQGVEFARVHLALPERSIFRSGQGAPTAAVTIKMAPGSTLTRERVEGIRQLIASSVPGLTQAAVAVLDENGDLVSPAVVPGDGMAAADAGTALGRYYQLTAKEALARAVPEVASEVIVDVRRDGDGSTPAATGEHGLPERRDVSMTVVVRTEAPPADEVRNRMTAALDDSLMLRRDAGDSLRFVVGSLGMAPLPSVLTPAPRIAATPVAVIPVAAGEATRAFGWPWAAGLALLVVLTTAWLRSRRRRLDDDEVASFAAQLKAYAPDRVSANAA